MTPDPSSRPPRTTALALPGGRFAVPANRWDLLDGHQPARPPAVSVVIPYFEDQRRLEFVLQGLLLQTHPRSRLQVVVADDGSSRAPVLPSWLGGLDAAVVRQADQGFRAGAARNLGAASSEGELLVFLDGDTIPGPAFVEQLCRLPSLVPATMTTGSRAHVDLSGWTSRAVSEWLAGHGDAPPQLAAPDWLDALHAATGDLLALGDHAHEAVISAVLAVDRSLFEELRGFDETFDEYGGEDWDLAHRALCAGAVLAHVPPAAAFHDGDEWAVRSRGDRSAHGAKARERARLAQTIPSPRTRDGRPGPPARPAIVVRVAGDGPAAALRATLGSLAADTEADATTWITGASERDRAALGFGGAARIRAGDPPLDALRRASALVDLQPGVELAPRALGAIAGAVGPVAGNGELTIGGLVRARSTSAVARGRRVARELPTDEHELTADLFGSRHEPAWPGVQPG